MPVETVEKWLSLNEVIAFISSLWTMFCVSLNHRFERVSYLSSSLHVIIFLFARHCEFRFYHFSVQ